jgi:hypothetical protein
MRRILRRLLTANGAWAEERCSTKLLRQDSSPAARGMVPFPAGAGTPKEVGGPGVASIRPA